MALTAGIHDEYRCGSCCCCCCWPASRAKVSFGVADYLEAQVNAALLLCLLCAKHSVSRALSKHNSSPRQTLMLQRRTSRPWGAFCCFPPALAHARIAQSNFPFVNASAVLLFLLLFRFLRMLPFVFFSFYSRIFLVKRILSRAGQNVGSGSERARSKSGDRLSVPSLAKTLSLSLLGTRSSWLPASLRLCVFTASTFARLLKNSDHCSCSE